MSSDLFVVLQYDRMPLPMPQIKLPAETTVERISQSLSQLLSKLNQWVKSLLKWNQLNSVHPLVAVINVELIKNGILLPKLFWPTGRKNCSSNREKLLKFKLEKFFGIEKHAGKVRKKYFRSIFGSNENLKFCFWY